MTHLTKFQIQALLAQSRIVDPTDGIYCRFLLGWRHGLRITEIITLRAKDFDMVGGYLTVTRLKGSLRTTQPLFPDEREVLSRFLGRKRDDEYLFPGQAAGSHITRQACWKQFQKLGESLQLPRHLCHPHTLKHSCGMVVIKQGIENARQYLGHKSIASTGAYLRVSDEAASQAAAAAFGD